MNWIWCLYSIWPPCSGLPREQVSPRALFMMSTWRTWESACRHTQSMRTEPSLRSSAGITHAIQPELPVSPALVSQRSTPANSHSCFFYICLPFLAPCMVASMSQQGASSWMDQHILFRCPSSQWVGNGFWSKAMLRQCWKERPEDKLQNSKCPVSN